MIKDPGPHLILSCLYPDLIRGRSLVLPQFGMPFLLIPQEACHFLTEIEENGLGERVQKGGGGREWEESEEGKVP